MIRIPGLQILSFYIFCRYYFKKITPQEKVTDKYTSSQVNNAGHTYPYVCMRLYPKGSSLDISAEKPEEFR